MLQRKEQEPDERARYGYPTRAVLGVIDGRGLPGRIISPTGVAQLLLTRLTQGLTQV